MTKTSPTLKSLGKIIFYLLATIVLGALLAAPLYWGGQWLAGHGILTWLAETPFRKFFHRGLLLAALALLWPTARWLRVSSVRALGLEPNPWRWRDAVAGFTASFLMMVLLAALLMVFHVVKLRAHIDVAALGSIVLSAVVVSILEEWLFRGAILGLLARSLPRFSALFCTSALFSVLHFLKPDTADPQAIGWLSGFALIPGAFAQFREPWLVLGGFTTLFCVGWILGWARLQTRSLWMPIGLHTGWVAGFMGFSKVTKRLLRPEQTLPWFGGDLKVGLGSVAMVLLTGLVVWACLRNRRQGA
ncbi:MAG: type II CAAX endopeptidase family protein [Verrucomicrobiota bacterium]